MSATNPETIEQPAENPHLVIAQFLDESLLRATAFFGGDAFAADTFTNTFQLYTAQEMEELLDECKDTVNVLFAELGGTPVIFENAVTSTTEAGIIEGCAGFNREAGGWEMVINTPSLAASQANVRLATVFGPGELAESYQRALLQPFLFLRSSKAPEIKMTPEPLDLQ